MNTLEFPNLSSEQSRRMALLVQLLERCNQPEEALELAERMEAFILHGASTLVRRSTNGAFEAAQADAASRDADCSVPGEHPDHASDALANNLKTAQPVQGLKKRRWTQEEDDKLGSLAEQGYALEQIASALDRTPVSIRERARARNIKIVPRKQSRQHEASTTNGGSPSNAASAKADADPDKTKCSQGAKLEGPTRRAVARKHGKRKQARTFDRGREAELIKQFLVERGPTRPSESIETVVKFMRSRDYSVVQGEDGHYVVDGRDRLTPMELVNRANDLRANLGRAPFPGELAATAAHMRSNGATHLSG